MNIKQMFMTQNDCYKAGRALKPKGIMVHSTAYPGIMAETWFSRWNKSGISKCVHAFVDDTVVVQTLPWTMRGWHCGGAGNSTHIGIELCEPKSDTEEYFKTAWDNDVELVAQLCKMFDLTEANVIAHCEGYRKGIASNHADPMHWFPKHGKNMDDFRADVKAKLKGGVDVAFRVLKVSSPHMQGADVKEVQNLLLKDGEKLPKYGADSDYGDETAAAVKVFQAKYGLPVTGIVDEKTLAMLRKPVVPKPPEPDMPETVTITLPEDVAKALFTALDKIF